MKQFKLLALALFVAILATACITKIPDVSKPAEDESSIAPEISVNDTSDEVSAEESELVVENPMASMTAKEIIEYSTEISKGVSSFVQDAEQTVVMDLGNGNTSTQSISYRGKGKDLGTENAMMSYSFTAPDRTGNFYFKNGIGYSNSNNVRLSFECTEAEFEEYVQLVIFQTYTDNGNELFENYIYENCTVTPKEDGSYELTLAGTVPYDMFAEYMESDAEYIKQDEEITCDYKVIVSAEGYLFSEEVAFGFVMETMGQTINVTMQSVAAVSDINENVSVVILDTGYTHVGGINVVYAALSHEYVMNQEYYKGTTLRKYKVNGYGFNDDVTLDIKMNYDGITLNKYAMTYDIYLDGTPYKYRYYFEDGKLYFKMPDAAVESVEYNILPKLVYEDWVCYNIDLSYGKDFAYTDNGDGTATLTYSLTKEMATEFADIYVYQIYGEEYYGLFAYADSAEVNEAKVTVIIDTETHCFISHSVKIDAKFVIEGETVTFKEESTQTFSPKGVEIPNRSVFLGTSSL
ncbi:MAG: hypothetical protein J6W15_03845 [Clostridia bacterium]|nr:hypothetical protein [Clostridia bacterium]